MAVGENVAGPSSVGREACVVSAATTEGRLDVLKGHMARLGVECSAPDGDASEYWHSRMDGNRMMIARWARENR